MHIYKRTHILKKQVLTLFHCIYVYFPLPTILITGFDLIVQPIMYRVLLYIVFPSYVSITWKICTGSKYMLKT